jgi:hypothetical protein
MKVGPNFFEARFTMESAPLSQSRTVVMQDATQYLSELLNNIQERFLDESKNLFQKYLTLP